MTIDQDTTDPATTKAALVHMKHLIDRSTTNLKVSKVFTTITKRVIRKDEQEAKDIVHGTPYRWIQRCLPERPSIPQNSGKLTISNPQ